MRIEVDDFVIEIKPKDTGASALDVIMEILAMPSLAGLVERLGERLGEQNKASAAEPLQYNPSDGDLDFIKMLTKIITQSTDYAVDMKALERDFPAYCTVMQQSVKAFSIAGLIKQIDSLNIEPDPLLAFQDIDNMKRLKEFYEFVKTLP